MSTQWLPCVVQPGMFSTERLVVLLDKSGERISTFVDARFVRGEPGEAGQVLVQAFEDDDATWAMIPSEQQEILWVNEGDLVPA